MCIVGARVVTSELVTAVGWQLINQLSWYIWSVTAFDVYSDVVRVILRLVQTLPLSKPASFDEFYPAVVAEDC